MLMSRDKIIQSFSRYFGGACLRGFSSFSPLPGGCAYIQCMWPCSPQVRQFSSSLITPKNFNPRFSLYSGLFDSVLVMQIFLHMSNDDCFQHVKVVAMTHRVSSLLLIFRGTCSNWTNYFFRVQSEAL